jgi:DNA polymerase
MIVETKEPDTALQDMLAIMSRPIPWAPGLILKGDGYICDYYRKD